MKLRNERFYRVGDWNGKEHETKKERLGISSVRVTFREPKEFGANRENMERVMEQVIDEPNVICRADISNNTLSFVRQSSQYFLEKTPKQIQSIIKGWRKEIKKFLEPNNFQIHISFTKDTILIELI